MTRKELLIAFFAGFCVTIGAHVYQLSTEYPPLPDKMIELCKSGKFHPDCDK